MKAMEPAKRAGCRGDWAGKLPPAPRALLHQELPVGRERWAPAARFRLFNRLFYWVIGRLRPFLLRLFCYAYIAGACILQVIYWRELKKLWNHHSVPIISA